MIICNNFPKLILFGEVPFLFSLPLLISQTIFRGKWWPEFFLHTIFLAVFQCFPILSG